VAEQEEVARGRWDSEARTYGIEGEQFTQTAEQVLSRAARMQRDGMSEEQIRRELDLGAWVTNAQLTNALAVGHRILERRIKAGLEPADSRIWIPGDALPLSVHEKDE
jgi:hypothetical protein